MWREIEKPPRIGLVTKGGVSLRTERPAVRLAAGWAAPTGPAIRLDQEYLSIAVERASFPAANPKSDVVMVIGSLIALDGGVQLRVSGHCSFDPGQKHGDRPKPLIGPIVAPDAFRLAIRVLKVPVDVSWPTAILDQIITKEYFLGSAENRNLGYLPPIQDEPDHVSELARFETLAVFERWITGSLETGFLALTPGPKPCRYDVNTRQLESNGTRSDFPHLVLRFGKSISRVDVDEVPVVREHLIELQQAVDAALMSSPFRITGRMENLRTALYRAISKSPDLVFKDRVALMQLINEKLKQLEAANGGYRPPRSEDPRHGPFGGSKGPSPSGNKDQGGADTIVDTHVEVGGEAEVSYGDGFRFLDSHTDLSLPPDPPELPPRQEQLSALSCAAYAPRELVSGEGRIVSVAVFLASDSNKVSLRMLDSRIEYYSECEPLPCYPDVSLGAIIEVEWEVAGGTVSRCMPQRWHGAPLYFDVIATALKSQMSFVARVLANGAQIGSLAFVRTAALSDHDFGLRDTDAEFVRPNYVFVSYSRDDSDKVVVVVGTYERAGIKCFFDRTSLRSGVEWLPALKNEIEKSDLFHLCWSDSASESNWVKAEVDHALEYQKQTGSTPAFTVQMMQPPPFPEPPKEWSHLNFSDVLRVIVSARN